MLSMIFSWIAMPMVRWGLIALGGVLFTAFMRADAAQPWKNQVLELKQVIAERERIIEGHNALLSVHEAEADKLKTEIEGIVHATGNTPDACVFTAAQLFQLRRIAGVN